MMIPDSAKIAFVILMMTLSLSETHAQDRSLGASFSYAGSGLSYERNIDEDTFVEVQLRAETAYMFSSLTDKPGITASFTWNMIFSELTSSNGNRICFFAGPGITAGSVYDLPAQKGLVFGKLGIPVSYLGNGIIQQLARQASLGQGQDAGHAGAEYPVYGGTAGMRIPGEVSAGSCFQVSRSLSCVCVSLVCGVCPCRLLHSCMQCHMCRCAHSVQWCAGK